ncbi:MAG TPA: hypothetical protein VGS22_16610 [Thermoanaerobaculia bacterium]|jgi:hypothetical protein|nr:hypothetical protein [Thermoanaerobaculia bacterium]
MEKLKLKTETLRRLDERKLRIAAGGARVHIPTGFAPDTTPLYEDDTTGG